MNKPQVIRNRVILFDNLCQFDYIEKVIIDSLGQSLYRLEVVVGGVNYYVNEHPRKCLTRRSIVEIQTLLEGYDIREMYLRHVSPHDEMIGHEINESSNELMVPLGYYANTIKECNR